MKLPFQIGIIGSGKRVVNDVLPAVESLNSHANLAWLVAQSERDVASRESHYRTRTFESLSQEDINTIALIYVAVPEKSVPAVVESLGQFDVGHCQLLLDTPARGFEEYGAKFASMSIAEDSVWLPWIEPLNEALSMEGGLHRMISYRALYRYHGVSLMRALVNSQFESRVRARLSRLSIGPFKHISFDGQATLTMLEPHRYQRGKLFAVAKSGRIFSSTPVPGTARIAIEWEGGNIAGFTVGTFSAKLTEAEQSLCRGIISSDTVVSGMPIFKRVGLARMIRDLAYGQRGYPVEDAQNDFTASTKHRS